MLIVGDDVPGKLARPWGRYELSWGLPSRELTPGLDKLAGGCCETCYLRITEHLKVA